MFSLRDLRFLLSSLHRDELRAQRIIGFFNLNYPQFNEIGKSDPVQCNVLEFSLENNTLSHLQPLTRKPEH